MNPNIPFRDKETALKVSQSIKKEADTHKTYKIMEVCGTHTMAIARSGLKSMLPENVELISGPGCPVCVTSQGEIDLFFELLDCGVSVASFGDLLRIPGSNGETLIDKRARGADVNVVYSPLDTLKLAEDNPDKHYTFLGIGFETTAPTIAALIMGFTISYTASSISTGSNPATTAALPAFIKGSYNCTPVTAVT